MHHDSLRPDCNLLGKNVMVDKVAAKVLTMQMAKVVSKVMGNMMDKVVANVAAKVAAKVVAKVVGKVVAKMVGKLFGKFPNYQAKHLKQMVSLGHLKKQFWGLVLWQILWLLVKSLR